MNHPQAYHHHHARRFKTLVTRLGAAALLLCLMPLATAQETIGGGTIASPAVGPAPSYGLGGPGFTLVKNWNFGSSGTIKNYSELSTHFNYHNHNQVTGPQIGYGAYVVSPDNANKIGNQPVEGVNTAGPVREFTSSSLLTYVVPLNGATLIKPSRHDAGSGSFYAKWNMHSGGSTLNQDILWETRVRYVPPKQFWFSPWTAGRQWTQGSGPEVDVIESYSYTYNSVWQNLNGQFWHAAVSRNKTVDYGSWSAGMSSVGVTNYDASQYHTLTWLFLRDNTCRLYVDNVEVQRSTSLPWRLSALASGIPVDLHFLFDATWGHDGIPAANNEMAASELAGKYFEWDYSRVYLRGSAHPLPVDNVTAVQDPAGSWTSSTSTGEGRYYGADYMHDGNTAKGSKTITFTPDLPSAGQYEVYAFWPGTPAGWRSDNTPFTINHADGATTVSKDQNYPVTSGSIPVAARWNSLGIYTFNAGTSGNVVISNAGTTDYVIADAVYFIPVDPEDLVVDNSDSGFTKTGTWTTYSASSSRTEETVGQYSKTGYLDDGNTGKGTKTATFTPKIPATGVYKVYGLWNHGATTRSTSVPYAVTHAGGVANLTANQNANGGQWNLLGTYTFNAGTAGKVVISNTGTSGAVVADAVRFVWVPQGPEIVIDNTDVSALDSSATRVELEGTWTTSSSAPGYYGISYSHDGNTGKGSSKYAEFIPDILDAGSYEVFARWTAASGRASNVPIDIVSTSGTTTVVVDQTQDGEIWMSLGTYDFDAGTDGRVRVRTDGTNGHVIADAVKLVPSVGGALPPPWQQQDVGTSTPPGNTTHSGGAYTTTAGTGGFHYTYQQLSGDCTITARVASMTDTTSSWNKAGVSIRESLAADSKQAMMIVSSGNGLRFEYKTTTGGTHVSTGASSGSSPYWVRVVRAGDTFTGYRSTDGVNWTQSANATISMSDAVYIGLVDYGCTTVTDNVTVSGAGALVDNPGFETEAPGAQTITGWSESGDGDASFTSASVSPHGGAAYLGHWRGTSYSVVTSQALGGLANGTYTLTAWVQRTGSQTTAQMEASGYGGSTLTANIPATTTWTQITISGINVTNGTCTIGFRSVAPGGANIRVDDVEFIQN